MNKQELAGDKISKELLDLADRVAKELGYVNAGTYLSCVCTNVEFPHDPHRLAGEEIFSWPVTGLMIEEMEREGLESYTLGKNEHSVFCILVFKMWGDLRRVINTEHENSYHKALAKAYLKAKEIIKNANAQKLVR